MDYEKIIRNWKEFNVPKTIPRKIELKINSDFITTITGPRRVGKTFLCFQKIHELIKKGISKENILYIKDDKLINDNSNDLEKLFETYLENSKINKKQNIFLFLDEIQVVTNWDAWIRKIYDVKENVRLILTGSSSKLLSREISTNLRGRVYNIEVLPLSFNEYLYWKNQKLDIKSILQGGKDSLISKKYFKEYLFKGGYPAIFKNPELKDEVLQNYYDSMIFKDIIERYKIMNVKKLQILAKLIFESTSKEISYTRLSNKLKSIGFSIGKSTIINYISYFEEAYLFFQVFKYEYSLSKQLGSIKKVYCIDNGLLNSISFKFSDDFGKLMENLIFLELYRRKNKIFYNRDKFECDFLIQDKNKIVNAIQVCYNLNEENKNREINGLLEAMEKFKLKEGLILTYDNEDKIVIDKKQIIIKPVWKWLLEK